MAVRSRLIFFVMHRIVDYSSVFKWTLAIIDPRMNCETPGRQCTPLVPANYVSYSLRVLGYVASGDGPKGDDCIACALFVHHNQVVLD